MADAKRDSNRITTLLATSNADGITPVTLWADPVTHRLLVDLPSGSGTVTSVSVTTANGISGTVATATTTPAITLTLGAITPTSVSATSFVVVTPSTDTIAGVFRRNNASQSANIVEIQTQANALLASFDKDGNLTSPKVNGLTITANGTNTLNISAGQSLVVTGGGTIAAGSAAYTAATAYATSAQGTTADNALPKAGGTMTGDITLGENASLALDPAGSADGKYTGITITGVSGYSQAFGNLVTLDKDDSRWEAVDISAAAAATGDARGIMGMVVSAGTDGNACKILLQGQIRADANFPALTIGAAVFASTTGDIVVAQPTTTDYVIRIVGYALTADEIYFNPDNVWTTHV